MVIARGELPLHVRGRVHDLGGVVVSGTFHMRRLQVDRALRGDLARHRLLLQRGCNTDADRRPCLLWFHRFVRSVVAREGALKLRANQLGLLRDWDRLVEDWHENVVTVVVIVFRGSVAVGETLSSLRFFHEEVALAR